MRHGAIWHRCIWRFGTPQATPTPRYGTREGWQHPVGWQLSIGSHPLVPPHPLALYRVPLGLTVQPWMMKKLLAVALKPHSFRLPSCPRASGQPSASEAEWRLNLTRGDTGVGDTVGDMGGDRGGDRGDPLPPRPPPSPPRSLWGPPSAVRPVLRRRKVRKRRRRLLMAEEGGPRLWG